MKLIATRSYSYDTRRLRAGDEFDTVNDMHARALVGARRARYAAEPVQPVQSQPAIPPDELEELRARAERLGVQVDRRWGVYRLQQEIMQAKRR